MLGCMYYSKIFHDETDALICGKDFNVRFFSFACRFSFTLNSIGSFVSMSYSNALGTF